MPTSGMAASKPVSTRLTRSRCELGRPAAARAAATANVSSESGSSSASSLSTRPRYRHRMGGGPVSPTAGAAATMQCVGADRSSLLRHGLRLEYATLGWNAVGIAVLGVAAIAARSVALAGFGLDSLIEIGASTIVVWELSGAN